MEESLRSKEEGMEEVQHSAEDQLQKLSVLTKERELSWQKQKEEIEAHYQQLLGEMQARVKVRKYEFNWVIIFMHPYTTINLKASNNQIWNFSK